MAFNIIKNILALFYLHPISEKRLRKKTSIIESYNKLAGTGNWDKTMQEIGYSAPDIVFGLLFEYIDQNQKLLDVGCGTGLASLYFAKFGIKIHGIDGSREMIKVFRKKRIASNLSVIDINKDGYMGENNFFDFVIAVGVFEFFKNIESHIKEACRVIRYDGIFCFTIEECCENKQNTYINIDGSFLSLDMLKVDVKIYCHNSQNIGKILSQHSFQVLKQLSFLAYVSPSTGRRVYYTAIVAQRKGAF